MSYNSKYKGAEVEEILDSVGGKVDKVEGKQLSTEDFTTALKQRLEGLSNYDDTEISQAIEKLRSDFDTLVSGDTTSAIKTFNEIIAFLDGIEDSQSLDSIIASIEQQIAGKGTVKSITAGAGLTGGTITEEGTIGLEDLKVAGDVNLYGTSSYIEDIVSYGADAKFITLSTTTSTTLGTLKFDKYGRYIGNLSRTLIGKTLIIPEATNSSGGLMTSNDKQKLDSINMNTKQDKITIIDHGTSDTTFTLTPNVYHKWGTVTSLNLTLGAITDSSVYNEYMFEFTSGVTATTLTLPSGIRWVTEPTIEANKVYQCSIVNNVGVIVGGG